MDEKGFRQFVKEGKRVPKGLSGAAVRSHIRMVKEFESFLRGNGRKKGFNDARESDIWAFVKHLAKDDRNTFANLIGLLRYSRFSGNRDAELALLMVLDGPDVLARMCGNVRDKYGKDKADEILGGYSPPSIGTKPKQMPKATADFLGRLESAMGRNATRGMLLRSPHAGPPEYYADERKMFKASKGVDEYLRRRREKMVELLRGHMEEGSLFFNQEIDQRALAFVEDNPEIAGGVRKGSTIFLTKIPYMMIEYLREKDPKRKRYYTCHCPLAREAILSGREMSRNLCYCSAGYEKAPFEVAFGGPVKVKVLKSALWGDPICRFAIEIPKGQRRA